MTPSARGREPATRPPEEGRSLEQWRRNTFLLLWVTYAFFYLGRVNLSVALPGIMGEFGLSRVDVGAIGTVFFWFYAIGQFVNGHLADRFGARKLVFLGLTISAAANLVSGFSPGLGMLIFAWAVNGYVQSTGWPAIIKTASHWFSGARLGRLSAGLGSSFVVGSAISIAVAGAVVAAFNWRAAFFLPSGILMPMAIVWYLAVKQTPQEAGLSLSSEEEPMDVPHRLHADPHLEYQGFRAAFRETFGNTRIWIVAWGHLFLNVIRLGFLLWAPTLLFETQQLGIEMAAISTVIFPLAGLAGIMGSGWMADHLFGSRRAPVATLNALVVAALVLLFAYVLPRAHWSVSLLLLAGTGFSLFGAQVLLITGAPLEYANARVAASAAGLIDGWGYVGAGLMAVGTGALVDHWGWNAGFIMWAACALAAAFVTMLLWRGRWSSEASAQR